MIVQARYHVDLVATCIDYGHGHGPGLDCRDGASK